MEEAKKVLIKRAVEIAKEKNVSAEKALDIAIQEGEDFWSRKDHDFMVRGLLK